MIEKFKKYIPNREQLEKIQALKIFGSLIHDPKLWHFNRRSVVNAMAVGLMCAWVPIPFQMALAAAIALVVRCNFPISVALVWLTNPATMPVLFYIAYKIGAAILSTPANNFKISLTLAWFFNWLAVYWKPFLLGCFICGVSSAAIGSFTVNLLWRIYTIKKWKRRKNKKL